MSTEGWNKSIQTESEALNSAFNYARIRARNLRMKGFSFQLNFGIETNRISSEYLKFHSSKSLNYKLVLSSSLDSYNFMDDMNTYI